MSRNVLSLPNPDGLDSVTYTLIKLERAPDAGGVPGAFAEIASIAINTGEETTNFVDDIAGATTTSWYRLRYRVGAAGVYSDYTTAIQFGDYAIRQWIKNDYRTVDILNKDWDQWRDETILEMNLEGLGRPAEIQKFTPGSQTDEWVNLNSDIRRVLRAEIYTENPAIFRAVYNNGMQWGRKFRIPHPNTTYTYYLYGIAEMRCLVDVPDEFFTIVKVGMRMRYFKFRQGDRLDFRPYLGKTKVTDVTGVRDFDALWKTEHAEYMRLIGLAKQFLMQTGPGHAGGIA